MNELAMLAGILRLVRDLGESMAHRGVISQEDLDAMLDRRGDTMDAWRARIAELESRVDD